MDYPKPSLTADMCLYAEEGGARYVLLIRRRNPPFAGDWALPGGFVEPNETVEDAAARELAEETGIAGLSCAPIGVFSEPGRDPRGWTVTSAYKSCVRRSEVRPVGMDDAAEARWFLLTVSERDGTLSLALDGEAHLHATLFEPYLAAGKRRWKRQEAHGIAFDHAKILAAALYDD